MGYFTDLMKRSYSHYTKNKDTDIAQYYFEKQGKSEYLKLDFYDELISTIDSLIEKTYSKVPKYNIDPIGSKQDRTDQIYCEEHEDQLRYEEAKEEADRIQYEEEPDYLYEQPIAINWEECIDAGKLTNALNNKGIVLKDPIVIIDPSEDICSESMVLRKSKLLYLREEAVRAKNAKSIEDLNIDTIGLSVENEVLSIEKIVRDAFAFTLKKDPRKHEIILSEDNYNNLIKWVTFYFENNFQIPEIEKPIMDCNTNKGNIRYTFKLLFKKLCSGQTYPINFDTFSVKCFHFLFKKDVKGAISQEKKPQYYDELIKNS